MNEWLDRRVIAFAHQGGSFEGPSSTLAAIEHALGVGASAIELDVHATKDRHLVVCHDHTIDRTTNHHGSIDQLTLEELREVDSAFWWIEGDVVTPGREPAAYRHRGLAPRDRRYGVATLDEVMTAFPDVLLNLDIKRTAPEVEGYEQLLAEELRRHSRAESAIVASFHDAAIQRFRAIAPEVATAAGTDETVAFFMSSLSAEPIVPPARALQVPVRFEGVEVVTRPFVEAAHAADLAVHVWTVNEEEEMASLLELGVDGIISDRPSVLANLLAERHVAWDGRLSRT